MKGVYLGRIYAIEANQLACSCFVPIVLSAAMLLLISTHRSAYRVNIANDIATTNTAGIKAPPDTHRLPIIPANTPAAPRER